MTGPDPSVNKQSFDLVAPRDVVELPSVHLPAFSSAAGSSSRSGACDAHGLAVSAGGDIHVDGDVDMGNSGHRYSGLCCCYREYRYGHREDLESKPASTVLAEVEVAEAPQARGWRQAVMEQGAVAVFPHFPHWHPRYSQCQYPGETDAGASSLYAVQPCNTAS